jgi:hypothetical protein
MFLHVFSQGLPESEELSLVRYVAESQLDHQHKGLQESSSSRHAMMGAVDTMLQR